MKSGSREVGSRERLRTPEALEAVALLLSDCERPRSSRLWDEEAALAGASRACWNSKACTQDELSMGKSSVIAE